MRFQNRSGWRGPRPSTYRRSPEETAALLRVALTWRQEWRAEMAGGTAEVKVEAPTPAAPVLAAPVLAAPGPAAKKDQTSRLAKFAEAIARAELGRAYWDKRLNDPTRGRPKRPVPDSGRV